MDASYLIGLHFLREAKMVTQLTAKVAMVAVVAVVFLMTSHGAHATPCATAVGCGGNPAPAPLLAAGIPAFVALGGGVAARRLWQKFGRRS